MNFFLNSLMILFVIVSIEVVSWWWMNPATNKSETTILTYQRSHTSKLAKDTDPESLITPSLSFTPLPDIYQQAAPTLRCTSGEVFYCKIHESSGLHAAFFEWSDTDTGSVLEAFRHMPEFCMGAIGLKLVSKEKPIPYEIDGNILSFQHNIFRDPTRSSSPLAPAPLIHSFRAVWVAANTDGRNNPDGNEIDRLRSIRIKSALTRYRPNHACVIQGAVRGIPDSELAWQAFEQSILVDLKFDKR